MKETTQRRSVLPQHFLVAVDAEGQSDCAIRAAASLAHDLGAKLSFVHAIGHPLSEWNMSDSPLAASKGAGLKDSVIRALSRHVQRVLEVAGQRAPTGDIVHVEFGRPSRVVHERAREIGADCVVLGRRGQHGTFDFGSTARAVLPHSQGVWFQPADPRPIRRVLVPVDLSESSLRSLGRAVALSKKLSAHVHALHCFDSTPLLVTPIEGYPAMGGVLAIDEMRASSKSAFARAMSAFAWDGVPHEVSFVEGRPEETIHGLGDAHDLIVMSTHGRSGLAGALLGHVAYSVLKTARIPTWAIRET